MDNKQTIRYLKSLGVCEEAVEWVRETGYSLRQAWRRCKRGDWMLWLAGYAGADRKTLVLVACDCAELVKDHWPEEDDRPSTALKVARAWARGDESVTLDDVRDAADAAYAANAADAACAAYAADAAYAAYAAHATHAAYAAYAAQAAAHAAHAADAAQAREKVLAECATICRRYWPTLPESTHD